jgi:phosphatidylglycerol:prolipoprotein diacylglycerol transferase
MVVLSDAYLHRLDPFAIRITESFGLRWYGLAYAVGFVLAWALLRWFARSGRSPLTPRGAGDIMTYTIIGVLVGGRLGYALFYSPSALWTFSSGFPFWEMLAIHRGGMASHGGVLGVIVACWLYGRRHRISSPHLLDMGAFVCTPGLCLGRLANFVNAELWGRPMPASMQANLPDPPTVAAPGWGVKYPQEVLPLTGSTPLEAERLDALAPLEAEIGGRETFLPGVVEAVQAGNEQVIATVQPLLTAYYPSQIFQAITDGPLLMGALALVWLRPRKPGVVGCWFLMVYGLLRILTEQFRQPDEGVDLLLGAISRGQVLSIVMVLAGAVLLVVMTRRDAKPLGGLIKKKKSGEATKRSSD